MHRTKFYPFIIILAVSFCGCATRPIPSTPENIRDSSEGYTQGILDAQGNAAWSIAGAGCGIFGVAAACINPPDPPIQALAGKSPEYTAAYIEAYQARTRRKNAYHATIGCAISAAIYLLILASEQQNNN